MEKLYYPLIRLNKRWWALLPVVVCIAVAFTACSVDRQQESSSDGAASSIVDEADSAVDGETAADATASTSTTQKTSGQTTFGDASSSESTLPLDDLKPAAPSATTTAQRNDSQGEPAVTTTIGSETGGTQANTPVTTTTRKAAVDLPFDYWD